MSDYKFEVESGELIRNPSDSDASIKWVLLELIVHSSFALFFVQEYLTEDYLTIIGDVLPMLEANGSILLLLIFANVIMALSNLISLYLHFDRKNVEKESTGRD